MVGSYLEQSLKLLSSQQQQIREHLRSVDGHRRLRRDRPLTQKNIERWRSVQDDIFKAMSGGAKRDSKARENERQNLMRRQARSADPQ